MFIMFLSAECVGREYKNAGNTDAAASFVLTQSQSESFA